MGVYFDWKKYSDLTLDEMYEILKVRQEVFVIEQRCYYLDLDGKDQHSLHLQGRKNKELLAYLRLIISSEILKIGRVLTVSSARKKGLGKKLMENTLVKIEQLYPQHCVELAAQSYLQKFYESFGFVVISKPYDDAGVEHIDMRKI